MDNIKGLQVNAATCMVQITYNTQKPAEAGKRQAKPFGIRQTHCMPLWLIYSWALHPASHVHRQAMLPLPVQPPLLWLLGRCTHTTGKTTGLGFTPSAPTALNSS